MSLKIETLGSFPNLPWNYLPQPVTDPRLAEKEGSRMLFRLPESMEDPLWDQLAKEPSYSYIGADAETLADPAQLEKLIAERLSPNDRVGNGPVWIGPPIGSGFDYGNLRTDILKGPPPDLVVMDCGIAHWNDRFWQGRTSRFSGLCYFNPGMSSTHILTPAQLLAQRQIAQADGQEVLIGDLAQTYHGSFWTLPPDPYAFWHGTGIADLVAKHDGNLYGVELPLSVLLDWGGDRLTGTMFLMLWLALQLIPVLPRRRRIRVVLAFGFTGGPQDGRHPAAMAISAFLQRHPHVELVVPAGNHRQERMHARLNAKRPEVCWGVPPGDPTPNVVEICTDHRSLPFRLSTRGASIDVNMLPGQYARLYYRGDLIGVLHARTLPVLGMSLRIHLLPNAPAGAWRIAMRDKVDADLWVLRDDADRSLSHVEAQQSRFFFDPEYRDEDANGTPIMKGGPGTIQRAGSASILATAPGVTAVAATVKRGELDSVADYSGLAATGLEYSISELLGQQSEGGPSMLGNGSARRYRLYGSSMAAALYAGKAP